jgi:predicted amidohydrolase YtcJ
MTAYLRGWFLFLSVSLAVTPAFADQHRTVYTNAVIFGSNATQLVVTGDRLELATRARTQPGDKVVDLAGGFVVVGLTDGHAHLLSIGKSLQTVNLWGAKSWAAAVKRVATQAAGTGWVFGRGWDQNLWSGGRFPTHHLLSQTFPKRAAVLTRVDGHVLVANAYAMKMAGITKATVSPAGGRILRDAAGQPTGVFVDNAMALIRKHIAPLTHVERKHLIVRAARKCVQAGLTRFHDMGMDSATVAAFKELDREGRLPLRVYGYLNGLQGEQGPYKGRNFRLIGVKLFADGAMGSRGAALLEPYSDEPKWKGLLQYSVEKMAAVMRTAHKRGLQMAVHAIGDRGVRVTLDALKLVKPGPFPPRIEHAQLVAHTDFARFKSQGVIASMQPIHATSDMGWAEKRVGPKRIRGAYAWRTMLKNGVPLVFGSDAPVESWDPIRGLHAALTRTDWAGNPPRGWYPNQVVTWSEALHAYTTGAAAAVRDDKSWADFTVFNLDFTMSSVAELRKAKVLRVVVAGKGVFQSR